MKAETPRRRVMLPNGTHDDQVDAMTQALLRWNMIPREPALYVSKYDYEWFSKISPI